MSSPSAKPIRLIIIDDHALMRAGLRLLLESVKNFKVVGDFGSCFQAIDAVMQFQPDIVLLDLDLGDESIEAWLPVIHEKAPAARVILLTGVCDVHEQKKAISAGAVGLVLKDKMPGDLVNAIERVHDGEVWLDGRMTAFILKDMKEDQATLKIREKELNLLSERENEVITLIGEGLTNKEIAKRLHISESTIRQHMSSIFSKLPVSNRLQLVIYAYQHGLAKLPSPN